MFTVELVTKFFSFLGVRGIIIIVLAGTIGVQGLMLSSKTKTIEEKKTEIATLTIDIANLQAAIKLQNDKIKEAADEKLAVDKKLIEVSKSNKVLFDENQKLKNKIIKTPLPKTCEASTSELKQFNNEIIKGWNK